ncbi:MAG: hypothetical protein LBB75_09870, partial [Oscillospiraceae bacterium]|nr:hypothetical protein [Oscillospiraceae bacterium]
EWMEQHPLIRQDLWLLLDDGWDVPFTRPCSRFGSGLPFHVYGSLEPNEARFPSFGGTPAERLRQLNEAAKQVGWKGIGLWVCAHNAAKSQRGFFAADSTEMEAYYRTRAQWCAQAGIEYWKVDWGHHSNSVAYRRLLTRVAGEAAPGLIVEHSRGCGPFNGVNRSGRYADEDTLAGALELMPFSEILRSYDVSVPLSSTTTLDRLAELLPHSGRCLLNCEDEPVIGAALGCALGVMRARLPDCGSPNLFFNGANLDETAKAVRWQRVAPAFSGGELLCSGQILTDDHRYTADDTWEKNKVGRIISQRAPAVLARNLPLPRVACEGEPPFVLASRNPNGAVTVAAMGRRSARNGVFVPLADVCLELPETPEYLGVFGQFRSLSLRLPRPYGGRIYAQDMLGDEAADVTESVAADGNLLRFPGELLERVGLASAAPGDGSVPGAVVRLPLA